MLAYHPQTEGRRSRSVHHAEEDPRHREADRFDRGQCPNTETPNLSLEIEGLVGGVGGRRDLREDIREEFDQDLQVLFGVEMIESFVQGFQLLVDEVL